MAEISAILVNIVYSTLKAFLPDAIEEVVKERKGFKVEYTILTRMTGISIIKDIVYRIELTFHNWRT